MHNLTFNSVLGGGLTIALLVFGASITPALGAGAIFTVASSYRLVRYSLPNAQALRRRNAYSRNRPVITAPSV